MKAHAWYRTKGAARNTPAKKAAFTCSEKASVGAVVMNVTFG
jgi:hypothetical protein